MTDRDKSQRWQADACQSRERRAHEERCADTIGRTGLDDLIDAIRGDVEQADAKPLSRVGAGVARRQKTQQSNTP